MKGFDESKPLEMEHRISVLEGRKESTHGLLESIKRDTDDLKARVTNLNKKVDRFFVWIIGIQFGILLTIIMLFNAYIF